MRYLAILAGLLFVLAGCDNPFGPDVPLPPDAAAVDPHPVFAIWWEAVEEDANRTRDFSRVAWLRVPGAGWDGDDGKKIRGMWVKSTNRIYIADDFWTESRVVKHEMLHAILGGDPDHTHPLFQTVTYNLY